MSLVKSSKRGAVGIVGQCILGAYFIVGTTSRLLTLVMIYFRYREKLVQNPSKFNDPDFFYICKIPHITLTDLPLR